jgi:type I restriction enzyme, S subunit
MLRWSGWHPSMRKVPSWLPPLPETWRWLPLSQCLSRIVDNRGRTAPTSSTGIALIATNCIKEDGLYPVYENVRHVSDDTYRNWFRGHPQAGDVIIVNKGTPGRTCLVPEQVDFCIAQDMVAVDVVPGITTNDYLFAVLRSRLMKEQVQNFSVGTMIPHFRKGDFDKVWVPCPPRPEAKRIGDLHRLLGEKIELNRKMNQTLEEMAQAIFKSWFIDFDGVPESEMVESELGMIPKGWEVGSIGEDFSLTMGNSPPGHTYNEDGEGVAFFQGATDFGWRFPTKRVFCTAPKRMATALDTLVSVRAPVGRPNIALWDCCIGRGVAALRHKSASVSYTFATARHLEAKFETFNAEGTVFGAINKRDFLKLPVVRPHHSKVSSFDDTVSPLDERIRIAALESRTLAELRDALLPRLISGEIRVPEAEDLVEAAV